MKISLKNTKTGKYLAHPGKWTDKPDAAKAFPDEESAEEYFTFRKLPNVAVVKLAEPGNGEVPVSKPAPVNKIAKHNGPTMAAEQAEKPEPEAIAAQPPRTTKALPVQDKPTGKSAESPFVRKLTVVEAKVDVGFGNALFIRVQGAGLSWEKGQPLNCINGTTWVWSSEEAQGEAVFKLLLNDQVWAQGSDLVVEPGKMIAVAPAF